LTEVDWTVVAGDDWQSAPDYLDFQRVPMRREPAASDVASFVRLWWLFRRRRFDFVQTHTPKASMLGLPAARLSGTRAVYTVHGALFFRDNSRMANLAGWLFEKWCCSWAHDVLVQSREDLEVLPSVRICPPKKIRYLGNGIDMAHFAVRVPPAPLDGSPVVLMISRLVTEKGCRDFFQVAAALHARARFVHVGPRDLDQSDSVTEEMAVAASRHVTFAGPVRDVRPYLAAADIVLMPSYREGIPRALMEAAAAGVAVVGYDVRGVREVVPAELGLLARRGDVVGIQHIVEELLDDPDRLSVVTEQCRTWVVERFADGNVHDRLRALYVERGISAGRSRGTGRESVRSSARDERS
jgi:glycosyltransferase involved in cell wall biosynthesis